MRIVLLLSGEHPTMPYSEAMAILDSEGIPSRQVMGGDQVAVIESDYRALAALGRAAFVMEGGRFLAHCAPSDTALEEVCSRVDWTFLGGGSFGVKAKRVKEYAGPGATTLQGTAGWTIKRRTGCRVDLEAPDTWIRCVLTDAGIFVYELGLLTDRRGFASRKPRTRPYFHPGVLEPKIARAFVNLSRVRGGDLFLDPFCGTGGFLIEGAMIGCSVVGIDADLRMVAGSKANIAHYGLPGELIWGDARRMPLRGVDGIATDPPYGRGTSTGGSGIRSLLADFYGEACSVLKPGRYMCTAAPVEIDLSALAAEAGFTVTEEHSMRVHKSLTRTVIVARKGR